MYYSPGKTGAMGKACILKWQETLPHRWLDP
jgi:hypothetical protein